MALLILGSSGMLGSSLYSEAKLRGIPVKGVDLYEADYIMDISQDNDICYLLKSLKPEMVINTVAITSLDYCEEHPDQAYLINARPLAFLASSCAQLGTYLIQVSTDHFYTNDNSIKHDENDPVILLNEYARSKFAAENFALTNEGALVLRTNIVGFKKPPGATFAGWVFESLENSDPMILFDDFYTSSLVVTQFAKVLFDLLPHKPSGVLNLASREVVNKKDFIEAVAKRASYSLANTSTGSVRALNPPRAESLGLDVARIEGILSYPMPSLSEVVDELILEYRRMKSEIR